MNIMKTNNKKEFILPTIDIVRIESEEIINTSTKQFGRFIDFEEPGIDWPFIS